MQQEYLWSPRFGRALAKAPVKPTPKTGEPANKEIEIMSLTKTRHIKELNATKQ